MNGELLTALERIEREKGISKEVLFEAIESALVSAARRIIDDPDISKEDISVSINKETGAIEVFAEDVEVDSERFGRIAAQTAKQVIIQKIREAERDVIYDKYVKKVGSIISGSVHRFEKGSIIVELDDTEAMLPKSEQIPRERFRQGESVRAYLLKVERGTGGPQIVLSRSDAGFVRKLFELEVPEISQGIVEIKSIARETGERTKIAVYSKDEKVDPVGACVGMRGSRVRDIVKELHGERIDIVRWDDDIRDYLSAAVSPAEVTKMVIDREANTITLTVPQDQLSLLIGKKGRNIRLASKLLGWELVAESSISEEADVSLEEIPGIGDKTRQTLLEAGYDKASRIKKAGITGLSELGGIGPKTAEKIIDSVDEAVAAVSAANIAPAAEEAPVTADAPEDADPEVEAPSGDGDSEPVAEEDTASGSAEEDGTQGAEAEVQPEEETSEDSGIDDAVEEADAENEEEGVPPDNGSPEKNETEQA